MANEQRLIDAYKLEDLLRSNIARYHNKDDVIAAIAEQPTVDAVEVAVLKKWLYEIAMNNSDNYLGDACEVLIGRLDGLREFAKERREGE